jgi:hypothetical protein
MPLGDLDSDVRDETAQRREAVEGPSGDPEQPPNSSAIAGTWRSLYLIVSLACAVHGKGSALWLAIHRYPVIPT